jgi:hypothetical protein
MRIVGDCIAGVSQTFTAFTVPIFSMARPLWVSYHAPPLPKLTPPRDVATLV